MPDLVNREEVQTLVRNGACLVEVLGEKDYAHAHIAGAGNIPLAKLNRDTAARLAGERMVVLYCNDFQ